jgi:predicted nucleic acid-binding protein
MATFTAIYDACVLHPAPLRDLLMQLALTGLYRARWTDDIHDEWISSLLERRPDLDPAKLQRTRTLMDENVLDCKVTGYQELIPSLTLPDPDDRHVLAAAIKANAHVIVTFNLKDFPAESIEPYGVEAQHPDEFVRHLIDLSPGAVCGAVRLQRANLKNPPLSPERLLDKLEQAIPQTVSHLRQYASIL